MYWVFIFSFWGYILTVLRLLHLSPFSPLLLLILNTLATCVLVLIKKNVSLPVSLFLVGTHIIPLYLLRKDTIDIVGSLIVFGLYLAFLKYNGTNPLKVYNHVMEQPMPTIASYLKDRTSFGASFQKDT
jgi:hypothetical protein